MHITFLPSTFWPMPSQMNFLDDVQAKSRTLLAWKTQVFLAEDGLASLFLASSSVTISTGTFEFFAWLYRASCAADKTAGYFKHPPGRPPTGSAGRVIA